MAVIDELKSIGGEGAEVQLGNFHQGAFRKGIEDVNGVDIAGGYCSGIVLDWARRVLQSRFDRDPKYLSYETPNAIERSAATVNRMALAFEGHSPSYISGDTNKVRALAMLRQLKNVAEIPGKAVPVNQEDARLLAKFFIIPGAGFDEFDLNLPVPGALRHIFIDKLIAMLEKRMDPQHKARSAEGGIGKVLPSNSMPVLLNNEETEGTRTPRKNCLEI